MSAYAWRVDRTWDNPDGTLAKRSGIATISYDKARGDFDDAFARAQPGERVSLWKAEYSSLVLAWVKVREAWV